jgi:hypothetical protein
MDGFISGGNVGILITRGDLRRASTTVMMGTYMVQWRFARREMLALGVFAASLGMGIRVAPALGQSDTTNAPAAEATKDATPAAVAATPEKLAGADRAEDNAPSSEEAVKAAPSAARDPGRKPVERAVAQPNAARGAAAHAGQSFEPNPEAKFVCAEMTVTAEPTWRTPTNTVDFAFDIRNEGTEVLQIRAKGG